MKIQTNMEYSSNWVGIRNISDYSPFGVLLPERTVENEFFRNGYQGSERDDEVSGKGNSYKTFFRQVDPRIGRWWSIDTKSGSMPWQSPYCSMDNNPIVYNDVFGDSVILSFTTKAAEQALVAFMSTDKGKEYIGRFAAKGQTICGYTFTSDGSYHTQKFDLGLTDIKTEGWMDGNLNQGMTDDGYHETGMSNFGVAGLLDNGRFRINVNLNSNLAEVEGGQELEASNKSRQYETDPQKHKQIWNRFIAFKAQTLSHELFIHVESSVKDFTDNKLMDNSVFGGVNDHLYFGRGVGTSVLWYTNFNIKLLKTDYRTLFLYHGYKIAKEIHKMYNTGASDNEIYENHLHGLEYGN